MSRDNSLSRTSWFGPPPLIQGEDPRAYDKLLAKVTAEVNPSDVLEEIWVRDAVDLTWEIFRWRKMVAILLKSRPFPNCIQFVEKIDRLAMMAEARRNAALREIEQHRSAFARNLRQTIKQTDGVGPKVIEHKGPARKDRTNLA